MPTRMVISVGFPSYENNAPDCMDAPMRLRVTFIRVYAEGETARLEMKTKDYRYT